MIQFGMWVGAVGVAITFGFVAYIVVDCARRVVVTQRQRRARERAEASKALRELRRRYQVSDQRARVAQQLARTWWEAEQIYRLPSATDCPLWER